MRRDPLQPKQYSKPTYLISSIVAISLGVSITFAFIEGGKRLIAYVGGVPFEKLATTIKDSISKINLGGEYVNFDDGEHEAESEENGVAEDIQVLDGVDGTHNDLSMTASAYTAFDLLDGTTYASSGADRTMSIASITKIVTAVVAMEKMSRTKQIEITGNMLRTSGSSGALREGEKLRVAELLYPLLMVSSNDAAEALAQDYGRKEFVRAMNDWVQSIGAYQTYFADPSGLSPYNVSTVNDLSIIVREIYGKYPEIFDITGRKTETVRVHTWTNPTHFLNLSSYKGGKNGYTTEAGRTSVAIFDLEESPHAIIVLKSANRDRDILELLDFVVHSRP
jgi:D-alanyl-D-alanine carboxypeptidase (penicillin-binding protein 5/6)